MKPTFKKSLMTFGALAAIGAGAGLTGLVGAQGVTTTASTQPTAAVSAPADARQMDHSKGGHIGSNGTKETLLTGDTASKVTAAALAAVPGGTIERVENDAEGAAYEAHMTKADGTHVTVKFDSNFAVTATETGHGR